MDRNQPIDTDIIIDEADPPPQMIRTSVNGSILTPAEELLANQAERVRQWSDDNDLTTTRTHDYPPRIEFDFTPRSTPEQRSRRRSGFWAKMVLAADAEHASNIKSGDTITKARGHSLRTGDRMIVHGDVMHVRRVQKTNGTTLTVREWRWWDHVVPAWLYRAVSHLPKFPGTERR